MKSKSAFSVMKSAASKNIGLTLLLLLLILSVVVCSLLPPQILKRIVDDYLRESKGNQLLLPAILYLLAILASGVLTFFKEMVLTKTGQRMTNALRENMMEKVKRLPASYFTINDTGSVVSRFTNDVDTIQDLFSNGIVSMAVDGLKIVGIIVSIWIFSKYLGIIVLLLLPLLFCLTRFFQKNMLRAQLTNRRLISRVNNHIPETINNIEMIHSFSKELFMMRRYKEYVRESYQAVEKVNFYDSAFSPIVIVLRTGVIALMAILCSKQIAVLGISVGMVAAAIELITDLFTPIENLGMELQSIQQAVAGVKRVNEFLREKEMPQEDMHVIGDSYTLAFSNVSFGYEQDRILFSDFSTVFTGNDTVLFKGRTGAGKSTVFKLIMGLVSPNSGNIILNGVRVSSIASCDKRKLFGYVEQQFSSIPGDIAKQISLGDKAVLPEDIKRVMRYVGLDDYVETLPDGYNTDYRQASFSNGQNQLLAIARALVMNPPIILLDEITANLDAETENRIIGILQSEMKNRMLLSISHRLSDILIYDKIVTVENGSIHVENK